MGGQKLAISMIIVIMLVSLPSNLILMNNIIKRLSYHSRPYYLTDNVVNAFDWLKQNASHEDIVMSAAGNGFYLPTFSRTKTFIGHHDFTIDFGAKNQLVSRFFDPKEGHDFRKKLLKDYEVAYLFFSDMERGMGGFKPKEASYLKEVYENPGVTIFKVASNQNLTNNTGNLCAPRPLNGLSALWQSGRINAPRTVSSNQVATSQAPGKYPVFF